MENNQLLLAFYGDDFTGSTDAMEALASSGCRTVLFLEPPTREMLERFHGIRAIGVAGTSRAKGPSELSEEVGGVMERLAGTEAPVVHYKTCSTFDSSPAYGSIGEAIKTSRPYFAGQETVPLLVGAPALGRYTLFGNHFAKYGGEVFRLDRHPVMSRHPVTPMGEADLRLHLQAQLDEEMELMTILELEGTSEQLKERLDAKLAKKPAVLLFDALDEERLEASGKLLWDTAQSGNRFLVGSSGIEYALTAHWQREGVISGEMITSGETIKAADRLLVVSGSASPTSSLQIKTALEQGFKGLRIPPEAIASGSAPEELLREAVRLLRSGESVILYTALGPDDAMIAETRKQLEAAGIPAKQMGEHIGRQLGRWTKRMMLESELRRVVIAGGDTSGFVTSEMGIYGLEMLLPVSPGAPLCRVYASDERMDGVELALKGGQFGSPDYYERVRSASANA